MPVLYVQLPGALLTRILSRSFESRQLLILLTPDEDIGCKQGTLFIVVGRHT